MCIRDRVYTGSKNIALIGKSQEFGMGDVYEPGSKTFTFLGLSLIHISMCIDFI